VFGVSVGGGHATTGMEMQLRFVILNGVGLSAQKKSVAWEKFSKLDIVKIVGFAGRHEPCRWNVHCQRVNRLNRDIFEDSL
jgi:hypothetical protein